MALKKHVVECMSSHLLAWRRWTRVSREAARKFGSVGNRLLRRVLLAFRGVIARQRSLRRLAIARWRDLSNARWQLPFRAWYLYMVRAAATARCHPLCACCCRLPARRLHVPPPAHARRLHARRLHARRLHVHTACAREDTRMKITTLVGPSSNLRKTACMVFHWRSDARR